MKKSFVLYHDQFEAIEDLTMDQKGQLFDAIFRYNRGEEMPELSPMINMAFKFFKVAFERDLEKWSKVADRNKINGKKGGRPKANKNEGLGINPDEPRKPSGFIDNPKNPDEPRKPVSGSASVSASGSANVNEEHKNNIDDFKIFWDLYAKKVDPKKCSAKWSKLKAADKVQIFKTLPAYINSTPDKQYRKNPLTYLNGESWNSEIVSSNNQKPGGMKKNGFNQEYYGESSAGKPNDFF